MKSPFPGMDPYLERHWLDVHGSLIFLAKTAINRQLSDDLVVRSEERLIVEDSNAFTRAQHPDIRVIEHGTERSSTRPDAGVAVAEPLIVEVDDEPVRQRYVEIIDVSSGGRVVTVLEFLSPTNKRPGDGREKYQRKQKDCVSGGINLVEIDLTRQGQPGMLVAPWQLPPEHRTTYLVSVFRATWKPNGRKEAYPMPLRQRLSAIRVPLRASDADIVLDIQALVDQAYEIGRYERTTDYGAPCDPPLDVADAAWADQLLRAAGKR